MKRTKSFEDYHNMIRKLAWSFHYTTGLEWEELYGEACLAYVRAAKQYDTRRAALSTWIYTMVRNHLILYAKKQRSINRARPNSAATSLLTPEAIVMFRQAILPDPHTPFSGRLRRQDMNTVIDIVFRSPSLFLAEGGFGTLKDELRGLGWSNKRIKSALQAVKEAL